MKFRGYTYALRPTAEQIVLFDQFAGVCRLVWNLALDQRLNHWRNFQATTGDNLNYVTQVRELTKLRAEVDFVRAVHVSPQQRTLKALDEAFRRAWKGLGGYPQFKRKGVNDAFSFAGREIRVERINRRWSRVKLPKIGWVKFRDTRPVKGDIAEATVTRTALGWQISIGCKLDEGAAVIDGSVGIDRGVTVPLMLSDGTSYALPPSIADLDRVVRKAQCIASRRKRGSMRNLPNSLNFVWPNLMKTWRVRQWLYQIVGGSPPASLVSFLPSHTAPTTLSAASSSNPRLIFSIFISPPPKKTADCAAVHRGSGAGRSPRRQSRHAFMKRARSNLGLVLARWVAKTLATRAVVSPPKPSRITPAMTA
jgi:hypothetical protein